MCKAGMRGSGMTDPHVVHQVHFWYGRQTPVEPARKGPGVGPGVDFPAVAGVKDVAPVAPGSFLLEDPVNKARYPSPRPVPHLAVVREEGRVRNAVIFQDHSLFNYPEHLA